MHSYLARISRLAGRLAALVALGAVFFSSAACPRSQSAIQQCSATAPGDGTVNGGSDAVSIAVGNSVTYGCNAGYSLSGSATRTCQPSGILSGATPACAPSSCSALPTAPSQGTLTGPSPGPGVTGDTVTYGCNPGYTLTGPTTATCLPSGAWSAPPACTPNPCPSLTAPTNGSISATGGNTGDLRTYSCDAGFSLSGSATTTCQTNGNWSDPMPSCVANCSVNQHVASNLCVSCPAGSTRPAGDSPTGADTACTNTLCGANQYVAGHTCVTCALGSARLAGDDATGANTSCTPTCPATEALSSATFSVCGHLALSAFSDGSPWFTTPSAPNYTVSGEVVMSGADGAELKSPGCSSGVGVCYVVR